MRLSVHWKLLDFLSDDKISNFINTVNEFFRTPRCTLFRMQILQLDLLFWSR